MPAPIIAAGIGAAASIGGSIIGGKAQKKAANQASDTALQTATMNNTLARGIYDENKALLSPYSTRGNVAGERFNALLGLDGDTAGAERGFNSFLESTGARRIMDEGNKSTNQGYAARGMLESGAALKALQDRGQQTMQNQFFMPYMNLLSEQQRVGLTGASAVAGVGQGHVGTVTANNNSAGSAAANAQLINGQAQGQMYGGVANALGNFAGSFGSSYKPAPAMTVNPYDPYGTPGGGWYG